MREKIKPLFFIGGIILIICLIWGITSIINNLLVVLANINSDIAIAIITGAITLLVTALSILIGKAYEIRTTIIKSNREKKIPIYEELIQFMFNKVLMGVKTKNMPSEEELIKFMADFTQKSMVWGSNDVLSAWIKCRRASVNEEEVKQNPVNFMLNYENLIREIRKDLGLKNKNLNEGDILSLFVTDIDKYLKK
jgi:hypothetical protein